MYQRYLDGLARSIQKLVGNWSPVTEIFSTANHTLVTRVAEDKPIQSEDAEGTKYVIPVDILEANPNGFEMDNLYLDMNGIVSVYYKSTHLQ